MLSHSKNARQEGPQKWAGPVGLRADDATVPCLRQDTFRIAIRIGTVELQYLSDVSAFERERYPLLGLGWRRGKIPF